MREERLLAIMLEVHRNCWHKIQRLRSEGFNDSHWKVIEAKRFREGLEYHMFYHIPPALLEELPIHSKP